MYVYQIIYQHLFLSLSLSASAAADLNLGSVADWSDPMW